MRRLSCLVLLIYLAIPLVAAENTWTYSSYFGGCFNDTVQAAALDPVTGNVLWTTTQIGGVHWESPVVANGMLYMTDESARLTAFALPATALKVAVIEFYNAVFDHYFITKNADEITKLDNGTFVGWARTGLSFNVYPNATAGANSVCRSARPCLS